MKKILLIILLFCLTSLSAQDSLWEKNMDNSTVIIHKDPRVDMLIAKQAEINEFTSRDARRSTKGFRLMIISTTNREEVINAKSKVYTFFPELKVYLWHQSPYYKLKAGNFRERKEAEVYREKLNLYFPKGVFIMQDLIEVKPDKDLNLP